MKIREGVATSMEPLDNRAPSGINTNLLKAYSKLKGLQVLDQKFLEKYFQISNNLSSTSLIEYLGGGQNGSTNITESIWPISRNTLLTFRIVVGLYLIISGIIRVIVFFNYGRHMFYFTNLSYLSMVGYFVCVVWYSWRDRKQNRLKLVQGIEMESRAKPESSKISENHDSESAWNLFICWIISTHFIILVSSSFLVSLVYWTLLAEVFTDPMYLFSNISGHILNVVFMLSELGLNGIRVRKSSFILFWFLLLFYVFWAWIASAAYTDPNSEDQRFWVYGFLRFSNSRAVFYYLGIMFGSAIVHVLICLLVNLKFKLAQKYHPNSEAHQKSSISLERKQSKISA